MSRDCFRAHHNSVFRIGLFFLVAMFAVEAGAAERVSNENASGDCGKQVTVKRNHRWNPLKMPQKFENKFSDLALKISSVGIAEPAPVCPTDFRFRAGVVKPPAPSRDKASTVSVLPGL